MLRRLSRIFLLKKAAKETVLSIALIVAALTAMAAFANGITARTGELGGREVGPESVLILSESSSEFDFNDMSKETVVLGKIEIEGRNRTVPIRSTNLSKFLEGSKRRLEGEIPREKDEAIAGIFLARVLGAQVGDNLEIQVDGENLNLKITGTVETNTQASTSLFVSENFFDGITVEEKLNLATLPYDEIEENSVEKLRDSSGEEVHLLGDTQGFIEEVNRQALSLISFWFLVGCAVVLVGSGVGAARLVEESSEELETLRSIGARKRKSFLLMLLAMTIIALTGSLLGVSLGIVGSQVVSTSASWLTGGTILTPLLGLQSLLEIAALASASAIAGGLVSLIYMLRGSEL